MKVNIVFILVYGIYHVVGQDDYSGSAYDEDPMKVASSQSGKIYILVLMELTRKWNQFLII